MKYVAFMRGINVGGNALVKMEDLRKAFEELGFIQVKTLLNSGNVIFTTDKENKLTLGTKIEQKLEDNFGRKIGVIVRSSDQIRDLVRSAPFAKVKVTPETRPYVSFLSEKPKNQSFKSPEQEVEILHISDGEVCSVITLTPTKNTTDFMKFMEKEFGQKITTRNWNTVLKIATII